MAGAAINDRIVAAAALAGWHSWRSFQWQRTDARIDYADATPWMADALTGVGPATRDRVAESIQSGYQGIRVESTRRIYRAFCSLSAWIVALANDERNVIKLRLFALMNL